MKPFIFYDIYYAPIKALDDGQTAKFFRNLCDFLDGNRRETQPPARANEATCSLVR